MLEPARRDMLAQPFGELERVAEPAAFEQDQELVAAPAADRIGLAERLARRNAGRRCGRSGR